LIGITNNNGKFGIHQIEMVGLLSGEWEPIGQSHQKKEKNGCNSAIEFIYGGGLDL
jgi:hypothetical protein